jgi:plastocyanin
MALLKMKRKFSLVVLAMLCLLLLNGCGSQDIAKIHTKQPPTIFISTNFSYVRPGDEVIFGISSSDDNAIFKVECDFNGDGLWDTDVTGFNSYSYKYDAIGSYTISCRATDNSGLSTISNSVIMTIAHRPGDIVRAFPFPDGVTGVSDVVFDGASRSLLVFVYDVLKNWQVTKIIQIDPLLGVVLKTTTVTNPTFFMNHESRFTKAGEYYYGTSYGWSNGVPQLFVYKIDLDGNILTSFPCPATNAGGRCEGLAWDGQCFWSGASDNKNLTQFTADGIVYATHYNVFDTIGITDIGYDSKIKQLVVIKEYLYRIDQGNGNIVKKVSVGNAGVGDFDGEVWWSVNNSKQQIEGIYVGD